MLKKLIIIIGFALCILLNGCDSNDSKNNLTSKQCEKLMHIKIPKKARIVGAFYDSEGLDGNACVKIELPPNELKAFIASSPFDKIDLVSNWRFVDSEPELSWFDSDKHQNFLSGHTNIMKFQVLNILIGKDDPEKIEVFLYWFETQ